MPVYTPENIHFTRNNAIHLAKGGSIEVKHQHLSGSHPVFLTQAQHKRLQAARAGGKGDHFNMQFSKSQMRHHLKYGGGFWDSLKKHAGAAFQAIKPIIRDHAHNAVNKLAEHGTNYANAAIGKLSAAAGKHIGHGNAATIAKHLQGFATTGLGRAKAASHAKLTEHGIGLTSAGGRGVGGAIRMKRKYVRRTKIQPKGGSVAGIPKLLPARQGAS